MLPRRFDVDGVDGFIVTGGESRGSRVAILSGWRRLPRRPSPDRLGGSSSLALRGYPGTGRSNQATMRPTGAEVAQPHRGMGAEVARGPGRIPVVLRPIWAWLRLSPCAKESLSILVEFPTD